MHQCAEPARDVGAFDPLFRRSELVVPSSGHGHRRIRIALLEIPTPDPTPGDLARLVIAIHLTLALPAVSALVQSAAVDASGLVDVKYLPVIYFAIMASLGHPEGRAHAVPNGVDRIHRA